MLEQDCVLAKGFEVAERSSFRHFSPPSAHSEACDFAEMGHGALKEN